MRDFKKWGQMDGQTTRAKIVITTGCCDWEATSWIKRNVSVRLRGKVVKVFSNLVYQESHCTRDVPLGLISQVFALFNYCEEEASNVTSNVMHYFLKRPLLFKIETNRYVTFC